MRYAAAAPAEADYFDERGIYKEYRPPVQQSMQQQIGSMNILRKVHNDITILSEDGTDPVPTPDFPFIEFPSTEVVNQSQIDFSSISDTLLPREYINSSSKAFRDARLALKSVQNCPSYEATHEEMREIGEPAVFSKPSQSTRDPTTISIAGNSNYRKSTPGTDTSVSFATETKSRSIMPTDDQALMALQVFLSDDFQSNSLQRKGENAYKEISEKKEKKDEAFQLIQKIHSQLQQVQCDLQKLHSLHKYEF